MRFLTLLSIALFSLSAQAGPHVIDSNGSDWNSDNLPLFYITSPITNVTTNALDKAIKTSEPKGKLIIFINSPGGAEAAGRAMIQHMQQAKNKVFFVCIGDGSVSSMAFNFMSFCDLRFMTKVSHSLVHNVYFTEMTCKSPYTISKLQRLVDELKEIDEPYRQQNSREMNLTLADYDHDASTETVWSAQSLLLLGYIQSIVKIQE